MATGLVIGIFPDLDAKALEDALTAQQIDTSKIKVVSGGMEEADESGLHFIDVLVDEDSNSLADDMTRGTGILADSGTSVPGLTSAPARLDSIEAREDDTEHYLADYPVPDDEVENFDEAIAEGRAVVLYQDPGADAQKIAAAFKAAGLHNVRAY